ncbi:zinc-binding dehydrogenase [Microbacterium sp. NPDC076895]|uniref:zinc-binding dehydrogenase n=1 Tax=Microbacterium sp. NPDC076895 TaxID=3154957 RepID=UPI00341FF942
MTTQQAWLFTDADQPLELVELPVPTPAEGEVLLEVKAAGLCHSDVGIITGVGKGWNAKQPIVLGHEVAGVVAQLGPGVDRFQVGDRVAVSLPVHPIGRGWTARADAIGLGRDGGYEHYTSARADELVPIPDGVPFTQAAGATDSVTTAYHAVRVTGGVTEGTVIGIIGLGGLGLNGARIAVLAGATVYGVDTNTKVFDAAREAGLAGVYTDAAELAQHDPDVVIDFAGFGATTTAAIHNVKGGGRVVLVGLGVNRAEFDTVELVSRNVTLVGSLGASKDDLVEVGRLISSGDLQPIVTEISFEEIPDGLKRLTEGGVIGRLVARIND